MGTTGNSILGNIPTVSADTNSASPKYLLASVRNIENMIEIIAEKISNFRNDVGEMRALSPRYATDINPTRPVA
jgi:hypothetical protein